MHRRSFDDYQHEAYEFAQYPDMGSNLVYPALGLTGEAGEVAEKVKKIWRNGLDLTEERVAALEAEIGDCIWYLAALATELGSSLSNIAQRNLDKLADRQSRGVIKSEGDQR